MPQPIEIPRVRYLCGLEENWDRPMYLYPQREEDAGWTTVSKGGLGKVRKARGGKMSK
jgi:hypothetical protein